MTYMLTLDEYSDEALEAEIEQRRKAREAGNCSYCGMPAGRSIREVLLERGRTPETIASGIGDSCRFPDRHYPDRDDAFPLFPALKPKRTHRWVKR